MRTNSAFYSLPVSTLLIVGTLSLLSTSLSVTSPPRPSEAGSALISDDEEDKRRLRETRLRLALKPPPDRVRIRLR